MRLLNDERHCEGFILDKGNNHPCAVRDNCLRYTESVRKRELGGDAWIPYMTALDKCDSQVEINKSDLPQLHA